MRVFSFHSVQPSAGTHPTFYSIDTGVFIPGVKRSGHESEIHLHLVPSLRTHTEYLHSPIRLYGVVLNYVWENFIFLSFFTVLAYFPYFEKIKLVL
jgi:hypothetical protein